MDIVPCNFERHGLAVLNITNDVILNSTALYEYEPRSLEAIGGWFDARHSTGFPIIGIEVDGILIGYGSFGIFRNWPAYRYSVEHCVYVHHEHRGRGYGRRLLAELIDIARRGGYHVMIGGIDAGNATSIRLHEAFDFTHAGTIHHAGFKFGRWLDLAFYQLILDTIDTGSSSPDDR
jgi:phosphinothricin acetyltransferase